MNKLEQLIRDFDDSWYEEIEKRPEFDEIKSAIESVVSNRNRVAHGEDISMTIAQLRSYYSRILGLLDILADQCDRDMERRRRT